MYSIKSDLDSVSQEYKICIDFLENYCIVELLNKLNKKYVDNKLNNVFLWDNFFDCVSVYDENWWKYIGDFVGDKPCILMAYDNNDWIAIKINSGMDLNILLSESCGFEFYIMDIELSYVICFNHHDVLIGLGKAKNWILDIQKNNIK